MTMEEGQSHWLISVGDTITKGQAVAVVMTEVRWRSSPRSRAP